MALTYKIGETISIALDVMSGDYNDIASVTAHMKQEMPPRQVSLPFTVSFRAASGDIPAGYTLGLTSSQTSQLRPGVCVADAKIIMDSGEVIFAGEIDFLMEVPATP